MTASDRCNTKSEVERVDPSGYGNARCGRQCRDRYEYGDKKELVY